MISPFSPYYIFSKSNQRKHTDFIELSLNRMDSLYLPCNATNAFFTYEQPKRYNKWSCQRSRDALHYRLDRFGPKLYRQIAGIPIGTKCAPLAADVFLFCYVRDFMMSLSDRSLIQYTKKTY